MHKQLTMAQEQAQVDTKVALEKIGQFKARAQELEKENLGLLNEMEKDRALFEDKVKFLTEQKQRLESERCESERRLKEEQDNLQRIRSLEKEKANKNRQECVTHLESYYKQMTQRLQDEQKKTVEESTTKLRVLQEHNQELSTQLEIAKRDKEANLKSMSERLNKQEQIEATLRQEFTEAKK